MDEELRFAIANRRLVQVTYGESVRVVEPHDYGVQKGKVRLLVYQRSASRRDSGRRVEGWRLLDVPKITECVVMQQAFQGSRGASYPRHYSWEIVYARVS